jgi:hypothetical protein
MLLLGAAVAFGNARSGKLFVRSGDNGLAGLAFFVARG